jgi:hypothetical protein
MSTIVAPQLKLCGVVMGVDSYLNISLFSALYLSMHFGVQGFGVKEMAHVYPNPTFAALQPISPAYLKTSPQSPHVPC